MSELKTRRGLVQLFLWPVAALVARAYLRVALAGKKPTGAILELFPIKGASKMSHTIHDIGVASQIGTYSDAIETGPQPAMACDVRRQVSRRPVTSQRISRAKPSAWEHVVCILERAEMTIADVVKVTQYLTRAEDIPAYGKVRSRFLGISRPASMLLVIPQLVRPEFLVEIEIVAAKA